MDKQRGQTKDHRTATSRTTTSDFATDNDANVVRPRRTGGRPESSRHLLGVHEPCVVHATRLPFGPGSIRSSYVEGFWSPALSCRPKKRKLKPEQ
jgi:hypothetical protein